jgi:hypothetical protein
MTIRTYIKKIIIWLFERYAYDLWVEEAERESRAKFIFEQATEKPFQFNGAICNNEVPPF